MWRIAKSSFQASPFVIILSQALDHFTPIHLSPLPFLSPEIIRMIIKDRPITQITIIISMQQRFTQNKTLIPTVNHISHFQPIPTQQVIPKKQEEFPQKYYNMEPFGTIPQIKFLKQVNPRQRIVAVILIIGEGTGVDPIFPIEEQRSKPGTQTVVATLTQKRLQDVYFRYSNPPLNRIDPAHVSEISSYISQVDPGCVLINFETCTNLLPICAYFISKGHMLIFSNKSLRCLIQQWDQDIKGYQPLDKMGPNPFVMDKKQCSDESVTLNFNPEALKKSPSAQLQLLGSLHEEGKCTVKTQGETIIYYVDRKKVYPIGRSIQILTQTILKNGEKAVGHALITFPSGGRILTSMTNWKQLQNVETSEEKVLGSAKISMGAKYPNDIEVQMMRQNSLHNSVNVPHNNMSHKMNFR